MPFSERYGPWAVIAGASEGTGRSFARQIAAKGVSLVLIAKDGPLQRTAEEIHREFGVETVTAHIDLSSVEAAAKIFEVTGKREIGLFINNAGADWLGKHFLDGEIEDWLALDRINVDTMLRCTHHFARMMRQRRRGGVLTVNSGACYGGSAFLAIYCAAKAFQLNFCESLWSELRPYGVDVLTLVLGRTDTPGYRRRREARGLIVDGTGIASADAVATEGLERLPLGPIHNVGFADDDPRLAGISAAERREKVTLMETIVMEGNGYKLDPDPN